MGRRSILLRSSIRRGGARNLGRVSLRKRRLGELGDVWHGAVWCRAFRSRRALVRTPSSLTLMLTTIGPGRSESPSTAQMTRQPTAMLTNHRSMLLVTYSRAHLMLLTLSLCICAFPTSLIFSCSSCIVAWSPALVASPIWRSNVSCTSSLHLFSALVQKSRPLGIQLRCTSMCREGKLRGAMRAADDTRASMAES